MKRCLWVIPKAIYPIRDGARVANHALLSSIDDNLSIDLLMYNESPSDLEYLTTYQKEFNLKNIFFISKKSNISNWEKGFKFIKSLILKPSLPVTTAYFTGADESEKFRALLKNENYDLVVFDGVHPYAAVKNELNKMSAEVIYRAHNVEQDLWFTAAEKTSNVIYQMLLRWQGKKMNRLEQKIIERSKKTWCISLEDQERFQKLYPTMSKKLTLIPVGLKFKSLFRENRKENSKINLLFLGKMDWAPNKDGLKWFLEDVWPKVNQEKFNLSIVGSGDSSWCAPLIKGKNIELKGFVPSIDDIYKTTDFMIVPIRYGSGTRIKVIESASKAIPIISTQMGIQGSGLTHYIKAESAQEWVSVLNNLEIAESIELSKKSFDELYEIYAPEVIVKKALESIS